jgi:hypothetical protein
MTYLNPICFGKIFSCFITNKIKYKDYIALGASLNLTSLVELKLFPTLLGAQKSFLSTVDSLPGSGYGSLLLSTGFVEINLRRRDQYNDLSTYTNYHLEFKATD